MTFRSIIKRTSKLLTMLLVLCMLLSISAIAAFASPMSFTDVDVSHWAFSGISNAVAKGYFSGINNTTFDPEGAMTRAMFVTALARLDSAVINDNTSSAFVDVPVGTWYSGSVVWAAEKSLVNGTSATTFSPDAPITREDMVVMIVRYTDSKNATLQQTKVGSSFSDHNQISSYALSSVDSAVKANLVTGLADGRFAPKSTSTRAQVATMMSRINSVVSSPNLIGAAQAKSIALAHAGLTEADVIFIKAHLDWDDGIQVYDVEFYSGNIEYDYEIDAISGSIREFDRDIEHYIIPSIPTNPPVPSNPPASGLIGEAKAKSIALAHAGISENNVRFIKAKLERDDGVQIYDVEFKQGYMEYSYEIHATTGAILEWDHDYDD